MHYFSGKLKPTDKERTDIGKIAWYTQIPKDGMSGSGGHSGKNWGQLGGRWRRGKVDKSFYCDFYRKE